MKKLTAIILVLTMFMSFSSGVFASAYLPNQDSITSEGACIMDYYTGDVLFEHNGNIPRVPASMTKIMNIYLVYEAISKGEITEDTVVPISKNVYDKSRNYIYQSVLPLYYDNTYTVGELMDVVVTYSASGAAIALAELLGGSEEAFVEKMNAKAKEMGIDATYYDSCGIADNMVSPVAMANLARNIIRDYPDILRRSSRPYVEFKGNQYKSTNKLLSSFYYEGADGLKTGTTPNAGYCFCGTALRGGTRIITVTMSSASTKERFIDTAKMLDYGFSLVSSRHSGVYYTSMRTFINNQEVPTFMYEGNGGPHAYVRANDLAGYGFDVNKNGNEYTLTYNGDKKMQAVDVSPFKNKNGEKFTEALQNAVAKVTLNDGRDIHTFKNTAVIGDDVLILVDEFQDIYEYLWKSQEESIYIKTFEKEPRNIMPDGVELSSKSSCIMDFDTGDILYGFDENTGRPCASIAKMMSVYVILDAIKEGKLSLDTLVPISENVYNLSRNKDYKMMVNLNYDEKYTVDKMLDMMIVASAASCVTATAELLSGTEKEFVKLMNQKAKEIGIDSVFCNATGVCLNPPEDKENLMSAKDIAIMTRKMIEDYPDILKRTALPYVEFSGNKYYNLNKLFTDYYYKGADGFKSGMTNVSGYCMCSTAEISGKRIIAVTLPSGSNAERFTDSQKMFDYGFTKLGVDISSARQKEDVKISEDVDVKVNIDGNYIVEFTDQKPVIVNDRVFLPIRKVMETLEKKVSWNEEKRQVVISDENTSVYLTVGMDEMTVERLNPISGITTTDTEKLDASPLILNGRTLLPVRAVAEAFEMAVMWEDETSTVLIIAGVC